MALIYKPNALYMSPKNESIDVTDDITFSFMFKGYQLLSATGQIYQNSNIGEWEAISGATFNFDNANAPYYNNDVLSKTLSSGTAYTSISNNVNSTLGWGVTVYGVSSTQNASNNILIPAQKGFEMGDMVNVTGAGIPYTFIGSYDSKLSLGAVTSDTTAGDNVFAVSEVVYLNLTTGDKIQAITDTPPYYSNTAYYIRKLNEGASDPTGYFIAVYSTKAAAESGTGTRVTSAVANKTFYVNPVPTSSSVFYVGLIGGNKIKLYTSKEAALQSVSEAVVPLTNNSSYTIQAFENSQIVQFTPLIANSIVFDLDDVYGTNRGVTLTLSDNNIYTYSSANTLFTGQQLTATNGTDNKIYYIRVWENNPNTLSLFTNRQAALGNNSTYLTLLDLGYNNIYLSEVLQNNKSFTISWKDLNNIPMIVSWEAILYSVKFDDTNNIKSKNIIEKSGIQYNGNVKYEFEHLLLSFASNLGAKDSSNFGRYMVEFNLVDSTGFEYTGSLLFDVGYEVAFTSYSPSAIVNNCDSSVSVQWDNAVTIKGEAQDGSVGQIKDYLYAGNYGTLINRNNSVTYDVNIPENSFPTFLFQPSAGFNGTIVSLDGETESAVLRYDVIAGNGVFTFSITTKALGSTVNTIVNTDVNLLDNSKVYLIGYAEEEIYIREYADASGALTETSASGTTINIDGTVYHEPLDITLKGNTTQTTYSGKNLEQGIEQGGIDSNGADYYSTTAIRSKYYNDVSPSTQYIISMNGSVTGVNVAEYNSSKGFLSFTFRSGAFTTSATTKYIRISKTATVNDKFQIEQGSTVTPYEPYVGGMSSPNPLYPQTVHNVSGDNSVIVCGINRFRPRNFTQTQYGITVSYDAETQTFTFNGTCTQDNVLFQLGDIPVNVKQNTTRMYVFWAGGSVTTYCMMRLHDSTYTYSLVCNLTNLSASHLVDSSGTKPYDFIAPPNRQAIRFNNGSVATNLKIKIMVTDVTTNEYVPYVGNTYRLTLPTPIELNKIGDYQDYIYKDGSKWYLHKEIGKEVLDGTQDVTYYSNMFLYDSIPARAVNGISTVCDHFIASTNKWSISRAYDNGDNTVCTLSTSYNYDRIFLRCDQFTSRPDLNTWLESNPTTLLYVLKTFSNIEITDTTLINQLNNIEKAYSYNGTTNILQDNSGNPFMLEVQSSSYK